MRKIIHVDMDAFFAAVEQRDDPSLRGRPIAVGGGEPRGVVMTASYEARPFGVRSAMPGAQARRLCPDLVFVPPRMNAYRAVSERLRAIFLAHTPLVEPLSLDEAYLDVTEPALASSATALAKAIKEAVRDETGLTATAGVSNAKFLAKLASGMNKPDGLTVIRPGDAGRLIAGLPVERLHGVGPATARKLRDLGIATGADLAAASPVLLAERFGRFGVQLAALARGDDPRPVRPDRERRSIGVEATFPTDLVGREALLAAFPALAERLAERMARAGDAIGAGGRTVTLKFRTNDFVTRTRARSFARPIAEAGEAVRAAADLLDRPEPPRPPVRLLGVTLSGFDDAPAAAGQLAFDL